MATETTWITLAPEDLNDYQAAKIVVAARTKALAAGQADPFDQVMPDIVRRVLTEVRGCRANRVSNLALSIPPDLRSQTILLIIETMQSRLPGVTLDEGIKGLIADAKKFLARIAKCEVPIAQPTDPETVASVQQTQTSPAITPRDRNFTEAAADGI